MKNTTLSLFACFVLTSVSFAGGLPANLELNPVFTSDLDRPLTVRHAGDSTGRLFIVHQDGVIKIWDGSQLLSTPFLDISDKVISVNDPEPGFRNEQGLLGLAFDPNYSSNGYFYVSYNSSGVNLDDSIIERYQVSADPNVADASSGQVLFRVEQPATNHNGGDIHFGPDGYLYIGFGDGGSAGDPWNNAQNLENLLGAMLRIDVNPDIIFKDSVEIFNKCGLEDSGYSIPEDNPYFENESACGEIWSYGLRNPWRWSFDRDTGDLVMGDVGQGIKEEINFQPATSTGNEHYGWNCREGDQAYSGGVCDNGDTYVEPVITQNHNLGNCSITGGYIYRGAITEIQGLYVYADYCLGDVNFATPGLGIWSEETFDNVGFGTTSFGEDESGEVYMIRNSTIYKFELGVVR